MKRFLMMLSAGTMMASAPAMADPPRHAPAYGYYKVKGDRDYRHHRREQAIRRDTRIWRGKDNRYYCRRDDGTTGLLIGGAAGAVIGSQVAGRGDKTLGALLGGVGGALLGREIDRSDYRCR